jgi:hypothetical protein
MHLLLSLFRFVASVPQLLSGGGLSRWRSDCFRRVALAGAALGLTLVPHHLVPRNLPQLDELRPYLG